jgi:hypothetical protein
MATIKELPQTASAALCHSDTFDGAYIFGFVVGKPHVAHGCPLS